MKYLAALLMSMPAWLLAAEPENLLVNPNFELAADHDEAPTGWSFTRGVPRLMSDGGRSGRRYIRLIDESDAGTLVVESRGIAPRPGGRYSASVWTRARAEGHPGVYINFHNDSGVRIATHYARTTDSAREWTPIQVDAIAPESAATVTVYLYSYLKDVGTFDFDDASLTVTGGRDPITTQHVKPSVSEPVEIGSRRELFVDRYLIDGMHNARLQLHHPRDEGKILAFDKPWEGAFCGYGTVLRVGDRYRVYYRGRPGVGTDGDKSEVTCIAESDDGIDWSRPDVGLYEVNGTRNNNVVLAGMSPYTHNFSPFIDTRPGVDAEQRFKAICGIHPEGLALLVSPDGLRWKIAMKQIITSKAFAFDSQACAFWSESEEQYVCYFRTWRNKIRWASRVTSNDCLTWSKPVEMTADGPVEHLYTTQTHPYFRAPHLYVGLPARFVPNRQFVTEEQAISIGVNPKYFKDTSDAVFITSRGGTRFDRTFLTSFIRPGIGARNWVSRTNYPARFLAQTGPHEMSVYVNQDYAQPTAHLRRYSMRLDGFASARAGYEGGELLTRPLIFTGNKLSINFSTSAAGSVRVELQTADGVPVPGFGVLDCRPQSGNEIDRTVTWGTDTNLSKLSGKPVRLRFVMKDADVFAFQFQK
jgi:hypothetical protein